MNFRSSCPHCGRVTTAYTLPMNEGLARAFLKFANARIRIGRPLKKGELDLENAEYSNFQNLRHFELIFQVEKGRAWEMSPDGWSWLKGKCCILSPAAHMGGVTLPGSHPAWTTHDGIRKPCWIHEILPEEWKQRQEFQIEKTG